MVQNEGLCTGNEEVCIFVKHVNRSKRGIDKCILTLQLSYFLVSEDIGIRFLKKCKDYISWSAIAQFSPKDVHHGYAICFKYPSFKLFSQRYQPYSNRVFTDRHRTPYYRENIQGRVTVEVQLYRKSDENVYSDSIPFTYLPQIGNI